MNRYFLALALAATLGLSLSGCGTYRKTVADITGYTKVCIASVEYLQFPHGVTVQRNSAGHVVPCHQHDQASAVSMTVSGTGDKR